MKILLLLVCFVHIPIGLAHKTLSNLEEMDRIIGFSVGAMKDLDRSISEVNSFLGRRSFKGDEFNTFTFAVITSERHLLFLRSLKLDAKKIIPTIQKEIDEGIKSGKLDGNERLQLLAKLQELKVLARFKFDYANSVIASASKLIDKQTRRENMASLGQKPQAFLLVSGAQNGHILSGICWF